MRRNSRQKEFLLLFFRTVSKRTGMLAPVWQKQARNCEKHFERPEQYRSFFNEIRIILVASRFGPSNSDANMPATEVHTESVPPLNWRTI
jgi:hypothetical protein